MAVERCILCRAPWAEVEGQAQQNRVLWFCRGNCGKFYVTLLASDRILGAGAYKAVGAWSEEERLKVSELVKSARREPDEIVLIYTGKEPPKDFDGPTVNLSDIRPEPGPSEA